MNKKIQSALALLLLAASTNLWAHGDVVPQAVNTDGLEPLGEQWLDENPYRDNPRAIEIGSSAYNQNCAACHGLEAKSGGIAPDLRLLELGAMGDEWYKERVINGAVRDGRVYMPKPAPTNPTPPACATPPRWPSSRAPAPCGRWSTNVTNWARI